MALFLSDAIASRSTTRVFDSIDAIKQRITASKNYSSDQSDPAIAVPLRIFRTSVQQTWLVATPKRVYCILDDLRREGPRVQWSEPLGDLVDPDGNLRIQLQTYPKSSQAGLLDIGPNHKNWLFSYDLFQVNDLVETISKLLTLAAQRAKEAA